MGNRIQNYEKQNFMIIWGDKNAKLKDNQTYDFMKNRILQCETSKEFREKAKQYCENNVIYLISGSFAKEEFDRKQNLEWINQQINDLAVHSKAIIIFTCEDTIKINNWSMESLQQKYSYVTQLTIDYDPLYESIDNMIYNRIHRTMEQTKNLDFYFGSQTKEMLIGFQGSRDLNLSKMKPSVIQLKDKLINICNYIKSAKVKTAVVDYIDEKQLQNFYDKIEKCFKESYKNSDNTQLTRQDIVENILNLYTDESAIYKILNLFLNTMNPIIYQYMTSINKLFSQCLYEFKDDQEETNIKVYRGGVIQKYQYENLYKDFFQNTKNKLKTYVVFPQFLSSSFSEQVAKDVQKARSNEVTQITQNRTKTENSSKENELYLQSDKFKDHFQIMFNIDVQMDLRNQHRPKNIQKISQYESENEYLFQPYQQFEVKSMDGSDKEIKQMSLYYKI